MRNRVIKYLQSKEKQHYNFLDVMLKKYIDGEIERILKTKNYSEIEIYPLINKKGNSMEIYCNYYNLKIIFDFQESVVEYCIYLPRDKASALEKGTIKEFYEYDFEIEQFIEKVSQKLNGDSRLNINTIVNSKNKQDNIFKVLKILLIIISLFAIIVGVLYIYLVDAVIYVPPPLFIGIIVLLIVIYKLLDYFQKR